MHAECAASQIGKALATRRRGITTLYGRNLNNRKIRAGNKSVIETGY